METISKFEFIRIQNIYSSRGSIKMLKATEKKSATRVAEGGFLKKIQNL